MLTVKLDSTIPLLDQIVAGLREAIARGELEPGDALPPVRQLAADLGVNLNTVARSYRELEKTGLVSTVRGRGTCVMASAETSRRTKTQVRSVIARRLCEVFTDARLAGMVRSEIDKLIEKERAAFWSESS